MELVSNSKYSHGWCRHPSVIFSINFATAKFYMNFCIFLQVNNSCQCWNLTMYCTRIIVILVQSSDDSASFHKIYFRCTRLFPSANCNIEISINWSRVVSSTVRILGIVVNFVINIWVLRWWLRCGLSTKKPHESL